MHAWPLDRPNGSLSLVVLAKSRPAHVVAKWFSPSPLVAAKHYLQSRDAHFEVAIRGGVRTEPLRLAAT